MPKVRVLDGATGTMLERRGLNLAASELWATQCLLSCPSEVAAVHKAYVEAGADAISTCTYQLFSPKGLPSSFLDDTILGACKLARNSGARYVHGVLGPFGASLGSNAEFTGVYRPEDATEAALADFHLPRLWGLAACAALVDVVGFETLPRADEAMVLARLCASLGFGRLYFSFVTMDGERTVCGTPLAALAIRLRDALGSALVGFGVNCSSPACCVAAAKSLLLLDRSGGSPLALVVYPNMGGEYDGEARVWRPAEDSSPFLAAVDATLCAWRDAQADDSASTRLFDDLWIGGCCNTTDDEIRSIADRSRALN